jgi:hypothetical protein
VPIGLYPPLSELKNKMKRTDIVDNDICIVRYHACTVIHIVTLFSD